jgi:hypothetical protein
VHHRKLISLETKQRKTYKKVPNFDKQYQETGNLLQNESLGKVL